MLIRFVEMEAHARQGEIRGFHLPAQWMKGSEDGRTKFQINIVLRITPLALVGPNTFQSCDLCCEISGCVWLETSEDHFFEE